MAECKSKLAALNSDYLNLTTGIVIQSVVPPPYCRQPRRTTAICAHNISTLMPESKTPVAMDALLENCRVSIDNNNLRACTACGVAHDFQLREDLIEIPAVLIINLQRTAPDHKILTGLTVPEISRPVLGQQYTPTAVISHIGTSTRNGHFVAITRDPDQWTLRNDDAAPSKRPSPAPRETSETMSTIILQSTQLPAPHPLAPAAAQSSEPEEPWTVVGRGGRHSARQDHKRHKPPATAPLPTPVSTPITPTRQPATRQTEKPASPADPPNPHTTELHTLRIMQLDTLSSQPTPNTRPHTA